MNRIPAFYIAVQAYNSAGKSEYSNIEHFIIESDDDTTDPPDDTEATQIILQDTSIAVNGSGVNVEESTATIVSASLSIPLKIME